MAITLTDVTAGTTIDPDVYNTNNTAIENALNSINGAAISSGTVANGALANPEFLTALTFPPIEGASATTVYLPCYMAGTVVGWGYYITDVGTADSSFTIDKGNFSAGSWSSSADIVTSATVAHASLGDNADRDGSGTTGAGNSFTAGQTLRLVLTRGTAAMSGASDIFRVTLIVKAELTT